LRLYSERERTTDGDIRRAALRVDIGLLYLMATARAGGSNDDEERAAADWFVEKARSLGVEKGPLPPILRGRDLIREGYEPGRRMGEILRLVYELQLDGQVTTLEEALAAARRQ
jgi:tRNA nucleotidyltransferase (CCA-adding enzyme)